MSNTRVYIFDLKIGGRYYGEYAAFDESETAAKIRIEQFFAALSPSQPVEAFLFREIHIDEFKCGLRYQGTAICDRRKTRRSE